MNNTTNSNFGMAHLWEQGDAVSHTVALILLIMSIGSWFIIIAKCIALYKIKPLIKETAMFWQKTSWQEGLNSFSVPHKNPFHQLAASAHRVMQSRLLGAHETKAPPIAHTFATADWLASNLKAEVDQMIAQLQSGQAFLASTGATAPFIGLFGTVWGIYHALMTIGSSGSASIDQVAGPIGEALVMTGLGLAVAIPAVLGYNALAKLNKDIVLSARRFSDDLHTYLMQHEKL